MMESNTSQLLGILGRQVAHTLYGPLHLYTTVILLVQKVIFSTTVLFRNTPDKLNQCDVHKHNQLAATTWLQAATHKVTTSTSTNLMCLWRISTRAW